MSGSVHRDDDPRVWFCVRAWSRRPARPRARRRRRDDLRVPTDPFELEAGDIEIARTIVRQLHDAYAADDPAFYEILEHTARLIVADGLEGARKRVAWFLEGAVRELVDATAEAARGE